MNKRSFLRLVPLVFLLLASACSANSGSSSGPVNVEVTANDFSFQSSLTNFKVGTSYHFEVKNTGQVAHEMMIMEPIETGSMSMEELDQQALAHVDEADLQAGDTASFDYTFTGPAGQGSLEFACHLPGHYEAGMKLPITVE